MKNVLFLMLSASALFYFPFFLEEFEQGKAFSLVAFGCFAAFWVNWRKVFTDKIAFYLFLFTLSAAISAVFSINVHMSVFGNIKCRCGLLVIASYLIFYLAALDAFKDQKSVNQAIDIVLGCSAIVSLYAIAQVLGYDFKQWNGTLTEGGYTRPISLLGHPNFMANYLAMTLPFALWRMNQWQHIWLKILYLGLILISIAAIGFSLSRGMCIAAISGLFIYLMFSRSNLKETIKIALITIIVISSTLSAFPKFRAMAFSRMSEIVSPGGPRIEYPKTAINIWRRYPWFGVGTDAFELGFQNERSAHYWQIERGGSPHRAHNDFLNILATQGVFGALAAALLTFSLFFRIRNSSSPFIAPAAATVAAFYVAGLSSFAVISTSILFLLSIILLGIKNETGA